VDVADSTADSEFRLVGVANSGNGVALVCLDEDTETLRYNASSGRLSGSIFKAAGTVTAGSSFIIGSADLDETDMEKLDGITNGTAAANKALVVDGNKDLGTLRNLTIDGTFSDGNYTFDTSGNVTGLGTVGCGAVTSTGAGSFVGTLTADTSLTLDTTTITTAELGVLDSATAGTVVASKAVVASALKDVTGFNSFTSHALTASAGIVATAAITAGTSFIIGSADLNEADLEKLDGITNGTAAASKAVVLDAQKDITGFNSLTSQALTASAGITAGAAVTAGTSFIIGSADLNEADLEKLDGITDGTGAANKALVLDGNADVAAGLRSVTGSGDAFFANVRVTTALRAAQVAATSGAEIAGLNYAATGAPKVTDAVGGNGIVPSSGVLNLEWYKESFESASLNSGAPQFATASLSAAPLSGAMAGGAYGGGVQVYLNGVLQRSGSGVPDNGDGLPVYDIHFHSSGSANARTVCFNTAIDANDYVEILYLKA
jgi:hypothetical protein